MIIVNRTCLGGAQQRGELMRGFLWKLPFAAQLIHIKEALLLITSQHWLKILLLFCDFFYGTARTSPANADDCIFSDRSSPTRSTLANLEWTTGLVRKEKTGPPRTGPSPGPDKTPGYTCIMRGNLWPISHELTVMYSWKVQTPLALM